MHSDHTDIFTWDSQFETGMTELDRQHRRLVELVNSLGLLLVAGQPESFENPLLNAFDMLSGYASFHFRYEEELMQDVLSEERQALHKSNHEEFEKYLNDSRDEAGSRPVEAAGKLLAFLSKWLVAHIIGTDKPMAKEIQGLPAENGADPSETLFHAMNRLCESHALRTNELIETRRKLRSEIDSHKLTEFELHKFSSAVEHSPVSILITDRAGVFEYVNPKFTELTGYAFHELDGKTPAILKSGLTPRTVYEALWKALSSGQEWHGEIQNRKKNGELFWDHASISPIIDASGRITHYVSIQENITERKRSEEKLRQQKEYSDVIINSLPGIFYMLDRQGRFVRVNPRFPEITGYTEEEILKMNALDFFESEDRKQIGERIREVFGKGQSWVEAELVLKNGNRIPYFFTGHRTLIDREAYLVGLGTDISERKKLEKELLEQARTDMLTGLPNRRRFLELAHEELVRANRYGSMLSILMVDLDQFKLINDRYGHRTGDTVLVRFAEICRKTMRSFDIAGRMGGEEFAVLLPETDLGSALEAAERLRLRISEENVITEEGEAFKFSASFGVASLSSEQSNIDRLIAAADDALYGAKRAGRNCVKAL